VLFFDRFARLREGLRSGRVHTGQKEILSFLSGRLGKADLPAAVVEPAGESELRTVLEFAAEKRVKVAVASGLRPVEVRDLEGHLLILTTRFTGAPVFSASRRCVRAEAGLPIESLVVDLTRAGMRWIPLLPVPNSTSPGELFARGWEGLRNWRDGGLLAHVRAVSWMGFDGKTYRTGTAALPDGNPDVSGFLCGSRGSLGVITSLELEVQPLPETRVAALLQLPDASEAVRMLVQLREMDPQPETVVYWGETATQILREGTDNVVAEKTGVLLMVEWRDAFPWPEPWCPYGLAVTTEAAVNALWQELFRFPRTAARLYPSRTGARLRLPAEALPELEQAAGELGRDANYPVALWGTVEAGHFHVWVLQPDDQPRTTRQAEELLKKIVEVAFGLNARAAAGAALPFEMRPAAASSAGLVADRLRKQLTDRCDPHGMYAPLVSA
jgi:FAD/FMN-containing dehydrogenase